MRLGRNKLRRVRAAAAAVTMAVGLTVGGSIVAPGVASAHGCEHTSHYVWTGYHYDYDAFQGTNYYWNGSRYVHYHNWLRYHPTGQVDRIYDCFY
jgi:hypothetical protein